MSSFQYGEVSEENLQNMRRKNAENALRAKEEFNKDPQSSQRKNYLPVLSKHKDTSERPSKSKKRVRQLGPRSETPNEVREAAHRELVQRQSSDDRQRYNLQPPSEGFTIKQQSDPQSETLGDAKEEQELVLQLLDLQAQIKNSSPSVTSFLAGTRQVDSLFEQELRSAARYLRDHNQLLRSYLIETPEAAHSISEETQSEDEQEMLSSASMPILQLTMGKALRKRREKELNELLRDATSLRERALKIASQGGIRISDQNRGTIDLEKVLHPVGRRTLLILIPMLRSPLAGRQVGTRATEANEDLQELSNMRYVL